MQDRILKIGSWNVRGLGTPAKRAAVFDMLEVHEVGLICLQETHYTNEIKKQAQNRKFKYQYHSVHTSYSRGVTVLVKKGVMFTCKQISIDEEGWYVFLYCVIENREYVLANIYIPPPLKLEVMYKLMDFTMDKTGIPFIAMGGFNEVIKNGIDFQGKVHRMPQRVGCISSYRR